MKAVLTCQKIAPGKSRLTAEVEVSADLTDYDGVISTGRDIYVLVPEPGDDPKRLTRICVLHHSTEVGEIACFCFSYETEQGSFEIGAACEIK